MAIIASAQQGKIDAGKAIGLAAHGSRLRRKELRVEASATCHPVPSASIRHHTPIIEHTTAYVSIRQHTSELGVCISHLLRRAIRDLYIYIWAYDRGGARGVTLRGGGMRHLLRRAIRDFVNLGERHFALFDERLKSSFVALVLTCISQKTHIHIVV